MRVIYNKYIPFKGFSAITIWPFVFARKSLSSKTVRHEAIHLSQQAEMLLLPFFVWYLLEWLIRFIIYGFDFKNAYRNISFEQEAYTYEADESYKRSHYAWIKYLFKSTKTNTKQKI